MTESITSHILDTSTGAPAAAVGVRLEFREGDGAWVVLGTSSSGADGRVSNLLPDGEVAGQGTYRLSLDSGGYFARQGKSCLFPRIEVLFEVGSDAGDYHVPVLISPFGYTTYRGR